MSEKRFSWEYSNYDSTGEIYDWKRKECLITDYLQKYEIEEWCQELNKIVNENEQLKKENRKLKSCKRIIDLLNEFNDENQRITSLLQSERRELIEQNNNYRKLLNELAEENDVLKQQLKTKHIVNKQYEELQRLKEENKELKQNIEVFKMEIAELREAEKDNYNITDGLW